MGQGIWGNSIKLPKNEKGTTITAFSLQELTFENVCSSDKVVCKVKSNKKGGPCSCKYVIKSLKLMKMLIRFHSAKTQVFPQEIPAKLKQL